MKKKVWAIRFKNKKGKIETKTVISTADGLYYHEIQIRKAGGKVLSYNKAI